MIMRVASSRETLAPLRFESLKKDDLIAHLVGDETVQKSKHLSKEYTKVALTKLLREDDASVLPAGRVPCSGKCDKVLNVIGEDGHTPFSGAGQLSFVGNP